LFCPYSCIKLAHKRDWIHDITKLHKYNTLEDIGSWFLAGWFEDISSWDGSKPSWNIEDLVGDYNIETKIEIVAW